MSLDPEAMLAAQKEYDAGYAAYRRGIKMPGDHTGDFADGFHAAYDQREKFGPWETSLAAPDEWEALRNLTISGWVRYFEARLNPDLGEETVWSATQRPGWYEFFDLPDWLSESVEIVLLTNEKESFDE